MKTADPILSARDQLHLAFQRAAAEREKRQEFDTATGELGWVLHERAVMHGTVNRIRADHGLDPVPLSDIEVVERSAQGHIDWVQVCAPERSGLRGSARTTRRSSCSAART